MSVNYCEVEWLSKLNKFLMGVWVISLLVLFVFFFQWLQSGKTNDTDEMQAGANEQVEDITNEQDEPDVKNVTQEQQPVEPAIEKESIKIGMIGDVLLHMRIATYKDYTSSFALMKPTFESLDYLIANQESPPAAPKYALSGYPQFSSPAHIVRDIQNAGVDMAVIANNHIIDKGEGGITQVFENLDAYNMPYVGVYKNSEDANKPRIIEQKGIKIGMLAYTYGTNGLYLPSNSPYIVNYIKDDKIVADIKALKEQVDVVAVSMHWGNEYVTVENAEQNRLAKVINDAGGDIIFGSHPHILQPYELLTNENGQQTHVFYSISNFFATILSVPDSMIGGVASFTITKEGNDVQVTNPTFTASANLLDSDGVYRVYPLADVENLAPRNLAWVRGVLGEGVEVR